jgi:hypothetical protein
MLARGLALGMIRMAMCPERATELERAIFPDNAFVCRSDISLAVIHKLAPPRCPGPLRSLMNNCETDIRACFSIEPNPGLKPWAKHLSATSLRFSIEASASASKED